VKRIGVIGAGVMGTGLAQTLAQHDFGVVLVDRTDEVLAAALDGIRAGARLGRLLGAGSAPAVRLDLIETTTDYSRLSDVDFVIENITEKWELKKEVYPILDEICAPGVVFAANTSAISITRLAGLTGRPERVLGMHFMNPVPMKPTVEVIRGWHTSDETLATALELLADMGKEGIVVADAPGFVSNRVLMLTVNEWPRPRRSTGSSSPASGTRWARWRPRTSSGWTPSSTASRCSTRASTTASTGRARC
jgi:3-hydroxybutyryl-CoA dehydrogenase